MPGLGVERQLAIPESHAATQGAEVHLSGKSASVTWEQGLPVSLSRCLSVRARSNGQGRSQLLHLARRV